MHSSAVVVGKHCTGNEHCTRQHPESMDGLDDPPCVVGCGLNTVLPLVAGCIMQGEIEDRAASTRGWIVKWRIDKTKAARATKVVEF